MTARSGRTAPSGWGPWTTVTGRRSGRSPRSIGSTPPAMSRSKIEGLVSNGLAFSPDGRTMFHSDSRGPWIDCWDFDPETGAISGRRRFADLDDATGRPDGGGDRCRRLLLERRGIGRAASTGFPRTANCSSPTRRAGCRADDALFRRRGARPAVRYQPAGRPRPCEAGSNAADRHGDRGRQPGRRFAGQQVPRRLSHFLV